MSGATLSSAERYWVLVHAATRPGRDLAEPRLSAGAVLLALRDLRRGSLLGADERGRLVPLGETEAGDWAGVVLGKVRDRPLTEGEWVDRFCLSPTSTELRRALDALTSSVAQKIGAPLQRRRGLFGLPSGQRGIERSCPELREAADESVEWLSGPGEDRAATLRMLDLAGALRPLSGIDGTGVREAARLHRGSPGWRSCDAVVSLVEGTCLMGATLTGAL